MKDTVKSRIQKSRRETAAREGLPRFIADIDHNSSIRCSCSIHELTEKLNKRTANYRDLNLAVNALEYARGIGAFLSFRRMLREDREEPSENMWINYYVLRNNYGHQFVDEGDTLSSYLAKGRRQANMAKVLTSLENFAEKYPECRISKKCLKSLIASVKYVDIDPARGYFNRFRFERRCPRTREDLEIFNRDDWASLGQPPEGQERTLYE